MLLVRTIVGFPTTFAQFKAKYDRFLGEGHPELAGRLALTYADCNFTYSREIGESYLLAAAGFLNLNDYSRSYVAAEFASWVLRGATLAHDYVEPAHYGESGSCLSDHQRERATIFINQCKRLMSHSDVCRADEVVRGLIRHTPRLGPVPRFMKMADWALTWLLISVKSLTQRRETERSQQRQPPRRPADTQMMPQPGRTAQVTHPYPAAKSRAAA
jgi:hypothetical protein